MTKRTVILILLWAVVVLWMGVIFSFSMETAEQSAESSDSVLETVLRMIDKKFDTYSSARQTQLLEQYSKLIRKTAHFCIYAALGFFISNALTYQKLTCQKLTFHRRTPWKTACFSFLIGAAYAVSDEIHQFFVPGRSCQISDMLLDSAGVATGVAFSAILVMLIRKHKKSRAN